MDFKTETEKLNSLKQRLADEMVSSYKQISEFVGEETEELKLLKNTNKQQYEDYKLLLRKIHHIKCVEQLKEDIPNICMNCCSTSGIEIFDNSFKETIGISCFYNEVLYHILFCKSCGHAQYSGQKHNCNICINK